MQANGDGLRYQIGNMCRPFGTPDFLERTFPGTPVPGYRLLRPCGTQPRALYQGTTFSRADQGTIESRALAPVFAKSQGLKPVDFRRDAARLKSGPDTNHPEADFAVLPDQSRPDANQFRLRSDFGKRPSPHSLGSKLETGNSKPASISQFAARTSQLPELETRNVKLSQLVARCSKLAETLKLATAFLLLTAAAFAQTTAPTVITDPTKLKSQTVVDMQNFSIEKLYTTRAIGGSTWSPDGKQVAFVTNISGRSNIWLVPAEGGWPTQLTISDQRQKDPAWSPDGKWIAYASDYDGNEQWDVFAVSPKTGEVQNLTTTKETSEDSPAWSPDSKWLAYVRKPKGGSSYEIDVMEFATRHVKHITKDTPANKSNFGPIFSRDGKFLVYTLADAGDRNSNIFLVELASMKATNLTPHQGEQTYFAADISPDGKTVLITSNAQNGYQNVGLLDIATQKISWLTNDKWEAGAGSFSPDGATVTYSANVEGNTNVYLYDLATRRTLMLPLAAGVNSPAGNPTAFSPDGWKLLYYHNGPTAPNDLWSYDLKTKATEQLTHALVGGLRTSDMVEPYLVHYPSRDGKWTISAFVYIPNNILRDEKYPAIVYIHGGPTGQFVNSFNRSIQYLVNQGYLVIAPNFRGSTGYGKDFMKANYRDEGGGDLADVVDAAEWITKSGFVDKKKLISMGGSYGGYLTMMAVTKYPDMWGAGVSIVPYVNWFTELSTEDPAIRAYDISIMGDPVENKALVRGPLAD